MHLSIQLWDIGKYIFFIVAAFTRTTSWALLACAILSMCVFACMPIGMTKKNKRTAKGREVNLQFPLFSLPHFSLCLRGTAFLGPTVSVRLGSRLQHSLPKKGINKIWISTLPHKTHLADSSCLQFSALSLKTESATCVKGKKKKKKTKKLDSESITGGYFQSRFIPAT